MVVKATVHTKHLQLIGKNGEEERLVGEPTLDNALELFVTETLAVNGQVLLNHLCLPPRVQQGRNRHLHTSIVEQCKHRIFIHSDYKSNNFSANNNIFKLHQ